MIKFIVIFTLSISTLFAANSTIKPKKNFYIKDGHIIYKAIPSTVYKPMEKQVKAHKYKTKIVKGVILEYSK